MTVIGRQFVENNLRRIQPTAAKSHLKNYDKDKKLRSVFSNR